MNGYFMFKTETDFSLCYYLRIFEDGINICNKIGR